MIDKTKIFSIFLILIAFTTFSASWQLVNETSYGNNYDYALFESEGSIYAPGYENYLEYDLNLSTVNQVSTSNWGFNPVVKAGNDLYRITSSNIQHVDKSTGGLTTVASVSAEVQYPGVNVRQINDNKFMFVGSGSFQSFDKTDNSVSVLTAESIDNYEQPAIDGNYIYTPDGNGVTKINWNTDSNAWTTTNLVSGGESNLYSVAYDENSNRVAFFGENDDGVWTIGILDGDTGNIIETNSGVSTPYNSGDNAGLRFSNNGQYLALGLASIHVFDVTDNLSIDYSSDNPGRIPTWTSNDAYLYNGGNTQKIFKYSVSGLIEPPQAEIREPVDGTTKTLNYGENSASFDYEFSIDTNGADTAYDVLVNGSSIDSGTVTASANNYTITGSLSRSEGSYNIKMEVSSSGGTDTTQTRQFTVKSNEQPEFSIISPEENEIFYKNNNLGVATVTIPIEAEIKNSQETGTAYFRSGAGNVELGAISTGNNSYTNSITTDNLGSYSGTVDAEYSGGTLSSNSVSFDVEPGYPTITSYTTDIGSAEIGDTINATIEGEITRDEVERIAFSLRVDGIDDPSDVVIDEIDFQDQNSYTHSEENIYTLTEQYQGREVRMNVLVTDTQGRTGLRTGHFVTFGSPPDEFKLNSPDPGQLFLIDQGDTETNVDIEYGIDTSAFSGTAELIVNGNVQDSFSVENDTTKTATYSEDYSEGRYNWKVNFTDSLGTEYESNSIYFDVTDEPINLNLKSPQNGAEINLLDQDSTTVDHDFNVDSRALNGNYYYRFTLENTNTNTILRNRTSTDFNSGQDSYTQTVSGLSNASYEWTVKIYRSSDDTLLESKTSSYSIVKEPLFDISIDSPVDGSVYQVAPGNTTDVTVQYNVETFAEATDFTLTRNGTTVATHSVPQATSKTFRTTLNDLSPDQYKIKLKGEDAEGNKNSTSISFNINAVEEDKDQEKGVPEVYEAHFNPPIDEARVGDELDLYIEGSHYPEDVDFVDVKVETGAGTKTFTVPGDQLNRQNSFNYTVTDAVTVSSAMLGNPVSVFGSLTSVAGEVSSYFFSLGEAGGSTSIGAVPNYPASNVSIPQPPGVSEDVRFNFNVQSLSQSVDYEVLVKDEGTPGYGLVASSESSSSLDAVPPNSNEEITLYRNMDEELFVNQSRGQFKWKIRVFPEGQSGTETEDEYSRTANFRIVDSNETTLNFLNPSDNAELETPEGVNQRDVNFDFSVDSSEAGRLYIELYDDSVDAQPDVIYDRRVEDGRTPDSETETLETGSYRAVLHFESENVHINRTRDFSIVNPSESTECADPTVALKKPTYDILYSDSSYVFEWAVCNPNNYASPTSEDSPSNTTIYVEDDDGNVVESRFREYDTQGEVLSFSPRIRTDFPQGEYRTFANFSYPNTTIQSSIKNFEVVDFTKPESFGLSPDGRSFRSDEEIPVSWTTQAYEENVEVRAKIKRVGDYQSNTVFTGDLSANSQESFSDTITRSPGEYEFFVEMAVSPEGSASPMTFQSNRTRFSVASANLPKANFTLIEPEQGAEYDVPNGSESADVPFVFDVEVAGERNWKIDVLVQDVGEETGFVRKKRFELPGTAGTGSFNESIALNESGYRYRIRAVDPNGEETVSTTRSFVVDNPETEGIPELPNPDPDEGFFEKAVDRLNGAIAGFVAIVGTAGLFLVATSLTVATGIVIHLLTDSDGLSLLSMLATVVFFVGIGWYPGWVGMMLFIGSASIFMIGVRRVTTGGGE